MIPLWYEVPELPGIGRELTKEHLGGKPPKANFMYARAVAVRGADLAPNEQPIALRQTGGCIGLTNWASRLGHNSAEGE